MRSALAKYPQIIIISDEIYEAFVITKLNQLFEIHKTHEEAMASFK